MTNFLDLIVALAGIVLLGFVALLSPADSTWFVVGLAIMAFCAAFFSIRFAGGKGAPIALVVGFLIVASATGIVWQAATLLSLLAYLAVARFVPILPSRGWWAPGRVPWLATGVCALVTPIALVSWVWFFKPDIQDLLQAIPDVSLPILAGGAIAFAVVNALGEELIWRGLFQDRLAAVIGPSVAVLIQALSFGVQHAHGFPRGIVGVAMAGVWAIMLGWLRTRSGGIAAPVIAHIVADASVAAIVLSMARS
ncbi:MAG: type II CAAX endopeptidase family protein [Candidatus Latescibacterota bacterium]